MVITQCFYLNSTSPTEVANIVHSLKNSKCVGFDGLCISPIKDTIDLMAGPLSFSQGVFPDKLKTAKILPIFKCDDSSLFSNYKLISILLCLSSKHFLTSDCLDFLKKFTFLVTIRPHHSITMAILKFVNNIHEGFESNEYTTGIFLDLKKALILIL